MKFIFNFFLIFYIIYQTLEIDGNGNSVDEIVKYISEKHEDDKIYYILNDIFNAEDYKNVIEKFTDITDEDKSQKTIFLNLDELPNDKTLEVFSNELLKKVNDSDLLDTSQNFVYLLFLTQGNGIIITNHKNLGQDNLNKLAEEINDYDDPNKKLTKILEFLDEKINDDDDDDSGLSNTAKIVIIILSSIIAIIIIVIVIACLCKKNKQDAYNAVNQTSFKDNKLLDED
jgi:hypothetical protein